MVPRTVVEGPLPQSVRAIGVSPGGTSLTSPKSGNPSLPEPSFVGAPSIGAGSAASGRAPPYSRPQARAKWHPCRCPEPRQ